MIVRPHFELDLEKLTEQEAREILDLICSKFNVLAKCCDVEGLNDVSYLETNGIYDDNFHANDKI